MRQRLERERAEENRRNWLEHCDRMYRTHVGIAQEWAQKRADILQASRRIYARKRYTKRLAMILTHATSFFGLLHPVATIVSFKASPPSKHYPSLMRSGSTSLQGAVRRS